jgi:hypothetical protein
MNPRTRRRRRKKKKKKKKTSGVGRRFNSIARFSSE